MITAEVNVLSWFMSRILDRNCGFPQWEILAALDAVPEPPTGASWPFGDDALRRHGGVSQRYMTSSFP